MNGRKTCSKKKEVKMFLMILCQHEFRLMNPEGDDDGLFFLKLDFSLWNAFKNVNLVQFQLHYCIKACYCGKLHF